MLLSKFKPFFKLTYGIKKKAGRNSAGKITVRYQGGGHKKKYRDIKNLKRIQKDKESFICGFEYDPNRSGYIAKVANFNLETKNKFSLNYEYVLCPEGLQILDTISSLIDRKDLDLKTGDTSQLKNFNIGDLIYNIELLPGNGGIFAKAAGTFCQLINKPSFEAKIKYCKVILPSGNQHLFSEECNATKGRVSNQQHYLSIIGKAGRSRWMNIRPHVRGVAMNPVDHPHGGGQGKTKGGRPSVTKWSWPAKGQPTRKKKKNSFAIIKTEKKKNVKI